jgi:hypothetical protein
VVSGFDLKLVPAPVLVIRSRQRGKIWRTEAIPPEANRLMRDINAALVEQVLDVPKRERKPDVHHHRKADDLGRSLEIFERITDPGKLGNRARALNPL